MKTYFRHDWRMLVGTNAELNGPFDGYFFSGVNLFDSSADERTLNNNWDQDSTQLEITWTRVVQEDLYVSQRTFSSQVSVVMLEKWGLVEQRQK